MNRTLRIFISFITTAGVAFVLLYIVIDYQNTNTNNDAVGMKVQIRPIDMNVQGHQQRGNFSEPGARTSNSTEPLNDIDEKTGYGHQRLVIFAGPHKSASTTVETFFFNVFGPKGKEYKAFQHWNMPKLRHDLPWHTSRPSNAKQYSYALREIGDNVKLKTSILELIAHEYQSAPNKNVFLAAESFGKRNNTIGDLFIREIASMNQVGRVDIILNYRSPRTDHLVSNWKQDRDEKKAPKSFYEWLCTDKYTSKLDHRSLDVFGRAQRFLNDGWKVLLADLSGVEKDGLDVSHVIACEVLQVPCTEDGWIQGWRTTKEQTVKNHKMGDDKLTEQQYNGLETILKLRDCLYATAFQRAERQGQMKFLHQSSLLRDCNTSNKLDIVSAAMKKSLLTDEGIIRLLRDEVGGCK